MNLNRFFVGWLLVAGLVGVYAQSDDEDSSEKLTTWIAPRSKYRTLDESGAALNPTNEDSSAATDVFGFVNEAGSRENSSSTSWMSQEDYDWHFKEGEEVLRRLSDETNKKRANEDSSAATDVFGFVNEAGSRENSNPGGSTSWMSQEDYDWHFKKGEEVLRSLSDETYKKRPNGGWLDPQMQSHNRIPGASMWDDWYPISLSITKERVPGKELNKPGPSRLETRKEKANRERLDRQMQAHGKKILDQRISVQETFVDFSKNRMQTQQGYAESAPAINATFAPPYEETKSVYWKPEEKNIILKEFKEYINARKVPRRTEIETIRDKHQLLRSRTVCSIQTWIQRHIKKLAPSYKKKKSVHWKPEEKNIILKEFKEYIDAKNVPPSREIKKVLDKNQLLRSRTVGSIQRWIQRNIKELASPYERMESPHWKPEENNIILKEFKEYIDAKKVPLSREIETVLDKHQLLRSRTVDSIQTWIRRHIKKLASPYKKTESVYWKPEEKNIILKEFKKYIDAKKVPPSREIKTVLDKHQFSRSRTVDSIQRWIRRQSKKLASPYERMASLHWKPEEKNILLKEFKEYIDAKKVPLSREIETVLDKHQLLRSRPVDSIQTWIRRHIKKLAPPYKKTESVYWKPEEKNIILKEFKEYIDAKKVPPRTEIETIRDKHQLLKSRNANSIKRWIGRHIQNKA